MEYLIGVVVGVCLVLLSRRLRLWWAARPRDGQVAQAQSTYDKRIDDVSEAALERLMVHRAHNEPARRTVLRTRYPELYDRAAEKLGWHG